MDPVTVLSIDGGAAHGVIPATFLKSLEQHLMALENRDSVRLADYFDLIAGSGIGSLIAAMLTKPDPYDAKKIKKVVKAICKDTFPDDEEKGYFKVWLENAKGTFYFYASLVKNVIKKPTEIDIYKTYEKYWARDWPELETNPFRAFNDKLVEHLSTTQLHETITNLIVPAFHFDSGRPMVFSSHTSKVEKKGEESVSLQDVVLCSTATPAVFPFHKMNDSYKGVHGKFAGGSIMANNPSMLALQEGARIFGSEPQFKNYKILSLGTVRPNISSGVLSDKVRLFRTQMGSLSFALQLIKYQFYYWRNFLAFCVKNMYTLFNDITEFYMALLFPTITQSNYLRLEVAKDKEDVPSIINGSRKSIKKLIDCAKETLGEKTTAIDPHTGVWLEYESTNEEELRKFAEYLIDHRKKKLRNQEAYWK